MGVDETVLTGRAAAPAPPTVLRAGPVTALLDGPDLRHVRAGAVELVQRVYVALRDAPWNTIPAAIDGWQVAADDDRFAVSFHARHRHEAIDFEWDGRIEGSPDGVIRYTMDGVCHGTFAYSKIGFNVHHALDGSIGRPYRATGPDGERRGVLPEAIEPQRIVDGTLTGMFEPYEELAIEVVDGLEAIVRLEGDLLELQDHRNWIDANVKSYGTPLALGFPFTAVDGQRIRQVLTIRHRGTPPRPGDATLRLEVGPRTGHRLPAIGLGIASHGEPLDDTAVELLRALAPDHLRVDLAARPDGWEAALEVALGDAERLGASLELAVSADTESGPELARLATRLEAAGRPVARVLVYPLADGFSAFVTTTPAPVVALVRERLEPVTGPVVYAGGTNQSFSDINRDRPTDPVLTGVCFSMSPTVHAADDASIVENIGAVRPVVEFARSIAAPRSVHVSPVTIATRFGPYPAGPPGEGDLPPAVDVRQRSLLGAAWTVGCLAGCAEGGAASVTFYETSGWRGVVERAAGSPMPDRFPSSPSDAFPLYHVLADALELRGAEVLAVRSTDPLSVVGLALAGSERTVVLVANVTRAPIDAAVSLPAGFDRVTVRMLDARSADEGARQPAAFRAPPGIPAEPAGAVVRLGLGPYAVARLLAGPLDHA